MKRIIPVLSSFTDSQCFRESNINSGYDESHVLFSWRGLGLQPLLKCKMIHTDILKKYGAKEIHLKKDGVVFREQVIRTVKKMETDGKVKIIGRKISI